LVSVPWTFGTETRLERSVVSGKTWLVVPGAHAGLPVARHESRLVDRFSWRGLWDEEDVEIEQEGPDGTWTKFNDKSDWEVFDASKA
jgi:hypothetical protein